MGAKIIDEDGLFELIRTSRGKPLSPGAKSKQLPPTEVLPPTRPVSTPVPSSKPKSPVVKSQKPTPDSDGILWSEKHKPKTTKELIANPGPIETLLKWLKGWEANQTGERKTKHERAGNDSMIE